MAVPSNSSDSAALTQFSEHLKEFIIQGPIFLKLQETVSQIRKQMNNLGRKRSNSDLICGFDNAKKLRVDPSTSKTNGTR